MKGARDSKSRLLCLKCQAVYLDTWDEKTAPTCPHCGWGWFKDTNLSIRDSQKQVKPIGAWKDETPEAWKQYAQIREMLERRHIEEEIAHYRALLEMYKKRVSMWTIYMFARQAQVQEQARHPVSSFADLLLEGMTEDEDVLLQLESPFNLERMVELKQLFQEMESLWQEGKGYGLTLAEAIELSISDNNPDYNKIKIKLFRVRAEMRRRHGFETRTKETERACSASKD